MRKSTWLLTAAIALASACGDDTAPSDEKQPDAGADEATCSATITLLDYKLDPKTAELDSGKITLCAVNKGAAPHDLAVRDSSGETLGRTKTLGQNESDQFTVDLDAAAYDLYCTQGGHESLGMKGTLTIR